MKRSDEITIVDAYVNLHGGTEVTRYLDKDGEEWESVKQLPFFENGDWTPLGKLADFLMSQG